MQSAFITINYGLASVQRRVKEWAEHNFPLKVTDEHRRKANEFFGRMLHTPNEDYAHNALFGRDVAELAHLHAANEGRNHRPLIGAAEELGELCHAHLENEQGIRGTPEEWREKKIDAIGDILIYLLDYCNKQELDIEECLETALEEISSRDWIRFPKNGKTE